MTFDAAGYRPTDSDAAVDANRSWWDLNANDYLDEHGAFLGERQLRWCPEGLIEADANILGSLTGSKILELGAGAAQGSRWVADQGGHVIALDLSIEMLRAGLGSPPELPAVNADARRIPFADATFDLVFSAYGALPFIAELSDVHAEVARVLAPGGRWVYSVTHPIRWAFPDVPGPEGLTVSKSYFDRRPYVEESQGTVTYAEFHHTMADHVAALVAAGFVIDGLIEPQWPEDNDQTWGAWSPLRGRLLPGTAMWITHRP